MDCSQSNQLEMNPANHKGAKWRYESSSWPIAPALGQHNTTNGLYDEIYYLTPGAYTEKRRADFSKFHFVLIQIDIKMMKI